MPPTLEARTADRAIACLRRAIEELAAERPREARAMVANAAGSLAALREMIEGQILKQPGMGK
jgi:truncated hemoglobin YjbI